jgi:death on curing protein
VRILIPSVSLVLETHRQICVRNRSPLVCLDVNKIESALSSAFYPGSYPFIHGGIPKVAGALCFYLIKAHAFMDGNKRTALAVSTTFLLSNGWKLSYSISEHHNAFSDIIERCAASEVSKDELMQWFDEHKVKI